MKLIIEVTESYIEHLRYMAGINKANVSDITILQGSLYEERPQGEWIKEPNGKTTDLYKCSVCKRSIMLCKGADLTNYPFCHCGADMRGGSQWITRPSI